ncbi:MAG: ribulose phosphate epimerase [Nannocystis sp.]|nr:ribulose phosphate epimerase [Nannocystis sp.]
MVCLVAAACGDDKGMTASEGSSGGATDGATSTPTSDPGTTGDAGTTTDTPTTDTPTTDTPTTDASTTDDPTGGVNVECDAIQQDCPEGSKCTSYGKIPGDAWNANKCVPVMGTGQAGDDCAVEGMDMFSGIDNCAKGLICLSVDAELKNGACVEYCSKDLDCPNTSNGDGLCFADANEGTLPICLSLCDPLLQDCPGQGACYGDSMSGPPGFCFTPDPKNGGMDGDACSFANACLPGLNCAEAATQEGCVTMEYGCCAPFCALDEMTCTGAEECVPFYMMAFPGYENVGICVLPG